MDSLEDPMNKLGLIILIDNGMFSFMRNYRKFTISHYTLFPFFWEVCTCREF